MNMADVLSSHASSYNKLIVLPTYYHLLSGMKITDRPPLNAIQVTALMFHTQTAFLNTLASEWRN